MSKPSSKSKSKPTEAPEADDDEIKVEIEVEEPEATKPAAITEPAPEAPAQRVIEAPLPPPTAFERDPRCAEQGRHVSLCDCKGTARRPIE